MRRVAVPGTLKTRARTALFVIGVLAIGCRMLDSRARALDGLHGVKLAPVRAKADFTLIDTRGQSYDFARETAHRATLLYFGYTNCPDVCPAQMSNIAAALRTMSPDQRSQVRVVFVTTDPARDTPAHLRAWLDNFDSTFVGLRGAIEDVNQIESRLGLPASVVEPMPNMPGPRAASYGVGHAAQVLAFTPDDSLRIEYPNGFTIADWSNDLPKLLKITTRSSASAR